MSFTSVENRKEGTLLLGVIRPGTRVFFIEDNRVQEGTVKEVDLDVVVDYRDNVSNTCRYRIVTVENREGEWVHHNRVRRTKAELLETL